MCPTVVNIHTFWKPRICVFEDFFIRNINLLVRLWSIIAIKSRSQLQILNNDNFCTFSIKCFKILTNQKYSIYVHFYLLYHFSNFGNNTSCILDTNFCRNCTKNCSYELVSFFKNHISLLQNRVLNVTNLRPFFCLWKLRTRLQLNFIHIEKNLLHLHKLE